MLILEPVPVEVWFFVLVRLIVLFKTAVTEFVLITDVLSANKIYIYIYIKKRLRPSS